MSTEKLTAFEIRAKHGLNNPFLEFVVQEVEQQTKQLQEEGDSLLDLLQSIHQGLNNGIPLYPESDFHIKIYSTLNQLNQQNEA